MDTSNFKEVFESPKVKALTAQVAELEAEVMRLRNALETFIAEHEECEDGDGWMAQMCSMEALHVADEVLSAPFTPTALNELIDKVEKMTIERCAGVCKTLDRKEKLHATGYGPGYLTYTASDCEQIIRALPPGQIRLEELL